jgi:hypothetical protein
MQANLKAYDTAVQRNIREAQQQNGAEHRQRIANEAPKDTWFMANHTRVEFTPSGLGYDVGFWASDFTSAGLTFYPPFVVFGTYRQQANDFVFRATEPFRAVATERIAVAMRSAADEVAT